ncbi:MAG TPA: OsmC family protein [Bacteroidales bacterium]|nr:OsmC family protein [Bacteroidales bacterium]HNQ83954.1 OsmC family protein [Bacteroidales bacterium]HOX76855.1 OsmC family protein [Bacteroidales bacterium]HPI86125.1 OsmC family protein [Bacteroidales bacterium]HPM91564.1 OsmC family protein [Bacteroidales bacterium]
MKIYFNGNKQVFADFNEFTVKTDQSARGGGDGLYPEPFALFLASLGTCAGIFVKSFCDQRGIPTEKIHLTMEPKFDPVRHMIGEFDMTIHVPADFPEKYDQAVIQTASLCTVKRHLRDDIRFNVVVNRLS